MKKCQYCNINVGGSLNKCPFCGSKLLGKNERDFFPGLGDLRRRSFFYKIQLFIVWIIVISALASEYIFDFIMLPGKHLSLIIALWLLVIEFGISGLFKKDVSFSRILTMFILFLSILIGATALYLDFFAMAMYYIIPVLLMGTMMANFIFALMDSGSGSLVYLLSNLFVGAIPYLVLMFMKDKVPFCWELSLLLSVLLFVGAVIFKGRSVLTEIQKRLNV